MRVLNERPAIIGQGRDRAPAMAFEVIRRRLLHAAWIWYRRGHAPPSGRSAPAGRYSMSPCPLASAADVVVHRARFPFVFAAVAAATMTTGAALGDATYQSLPFSQN